MLRSTPYRRQIEESTVTAFLAERFNEEVGKKKGYVPIKVQVRCCLPPANSSSDARYCLCCWRVFFLLISYIPPHPPMLPTRATGCDGGAAAVVRRGGWQQRQLDWWRRPGRGLRLLQHGTRASGVPSLCSSAVFPSSSSLLQADRG